METINKCRPPQEPPLQLRLRFQHQQAAAAAAQGMPFIRQHTIFV
jgi:hypothetical protein